MPAQLAGPAARQDGDHGLRQRDAVAPAEGRPVGIVDGLFDQGMADEARVQSLRLEIGWLERKEAKHAVEIARDLRARPGR